MTAPAAPLGPLRATTERWGGRGARRRGATVVRFGEAPRVAILPAGHNAAGAPIWAVRAEGDAVSYYRTTSAAAARRVAIQYARDLAEALA